MSQISALQTEIYGLCEIIFEAPSRERGKSLAHPEKQKGSSEPRTRSLSCEALKDKIKQLPDIITQCACGFVNDEDYNGNDSEGSSCSDYDSDDGYQRVIPTIYIRRRGGEFKPEMKERVTERHGELIERRYELRGELYSVKQWYFDMREKLSRIPRSEWDDISCFKFRKLEDTYTDLMCQVFDIDSDINELQAMLLSFGETLPEPREGQWTMGNRECRVWSAEKDSYKWETPNDF
ncbi:hypothetical protein F5Y11DRAFT_241834 [Daldinia sp. FL1419]|nr:hypothetical protein F5Y11DRAFT_241834 [Daldinia sp. FL1419]